MSKPIAFCGILLLGFGMKKCKICKAGDEQVLMKIILNLTLPMTVLHAFSALPKDRSLYGIVLLGFLCVLLPFLIVYCTSHHQTRDQRIFQMINVAGYNIGCFALPLIQSLFGGMGAAIACLFDTGNAIMMTGGSYALTATLLHLSSEKESKKDILMKFLHSVPFDAYMILLVCTLLAIPIPEILLTLTEPIASANAFLAMLMLGMMIPTKIGHVNLSAIVKLQGLRLIFASIAALLLYQFLPFAYEIRKVLAVCVFAPISTLAPVYMMACGGNSEQASFANSVSIFLGLCMMIVLSHIL